MVEGFWRIQAVNTPNPRLRIGTLLDTRTFVVFQKKNDTPKIIAIRSPDTVKHQRMGNLVQRTMPTIPAPIQIESEVPMTV